MGWKLKFLMYVVLISLFLSINSVTYAQQFTRQETDLMTQIGIDPNDFINSLFDKISEITLDKLEQNLEIYYISYQKFPSNDWLNDLVNSGEMSKSYKDLLEKFQPAKNCWTSNQEGFCYNNSGDEVVLGAIKSILDNVKIF